jgi:NitT/TauT family transport system ATP-binding protein
MVFNNETVALQDVTFDLRAGEFLSLIGPSGCGKSTVLRQASGLLEQTSGTITRHDENIGYVFQDPTLLPWRSVQSNVELFLQLRGVPPKERKEIASSAINLVGLSDFAGHLPNQLSGGMKMRVSIARSLSVRPSVFLFDEPFGALDQYTRERLNAEINQLFVSEHFAGLFVTHSVFEATFLSTKVMVMSERPGTIIKTYDIPFEFPRTDELRFSPEFQTLCADIAQTTFGALK